LFSLSLFFFSVCAGLVCGGVGRRREEMGMGMGNGGSVNEEKKGDVGALQK